MIVIQPIISAFTPALKATPLPAKGLVRYHRGNDPERSESSTTTDFFHLFYNRVFHLLNSRDAVHDSESEDEVEPSEVFSHNVRDATSTSKLAVVASEPFEASKDDPLAQFYDQAREEHENQVSSKTLCTLQTINHSPCACLVDALRRSRRRRPA